LSGLFDKKIPNAVSVIIHLVHAEKEDPRMSKLAFDPAPKVDTPNDAGEGLPQRPTPGTPRWVKVFGIVVIALVLVFVVLHLTGHGFGGHTPLPSGAQQP